MLFSYFKQIPTVAFLLLFFLLLQTGSQPLYALAQSGFIATTTVNLAICGNSLVEPGETCDVPGETGAYSTTIAGRQCRVNCFFGPYCGDGILQSIFNEQCDDGNNNSGDFCSASCTIEPAGSGGGGSSGGGKKNTGGADQNLGDTQVNVVGQTFPSATVNIMLDAKSVGTVRSNSAGRFEFATNVSPGTVSMGFWTTDASGIRSITYNTTFDVTQGAITNVAGILIPPTIALSKTNINPGDVITISGQAQPNAKIDVQIGSSQRVVSTNAGVDGKWTITYDTKSLTAKEYTVKARSVIGSGGVSSESSYGTALQLFVGVDGKASTPSDLNRDGSVNLIDFSILIFWWNTNAGDSDPSADINGNGKVSIEDFSILLFNWTG